MLRRSTTHGVGTGAQDATSPEGTPQRQPSDAPAPRDRASIWPELTLDAWRPTYDTLHLWTQIVGKVRLALSPSTNHWWQSTLYVMPRGLTTSSIPYEGRAFELVFDFLEHQLRISTSDGALRTVALAPRSVADFYAELVDNLRSLGIEVAIWTTPVEMSPRIPFEQDREHSAYDPVYTERWWRILLQADRIFKQFNGRFLGKSSPVHYFWGALDLAVTRFSGRVAPMYSGSAPEVHPHVMHEAYSHEVISHGFWPGDDRLPSPAFYGYAVPQPDGFGRARIEPTEGFYSETLAEFILPYDAVRLAADPDRMVLDFMQTTYEAGALLGGWDRAKLEERPPCPCGVPRPQLRPPDEVVSSDQSKTRSLG